MINYKDYLNRVIECSEDIFSEVEFNNSIIPLFRSLDTIDWKEYEVEDDPVEYILQCIIEGTDFWVTDYISETREVCLEAYVVNTAKLDEVIEILEYHNWKIEENCLQELKDGIQKHDDENAKYELKSKIDEKLLEYDKEQLTEILNSLNKYDNT